MGVFFFSKTLQYENVYDSKHSGTEVSIQI